MDRQEHWDNVYRIKQPTEVSWYKPHLETSLKLIDTAELAPDAGIIDVGCGASTLMDDLLDKGFTNLTCMDVSEDAYAPTKKRLGERAANVL
ncbi:MAG TPA: hypothetical protein VJL58_04095 [Pyrinomonadaceae bacterium]|nr:hypothetical protein [Pyrinomonadaceae bacterium]